MTKAIFNFNNNVLSNFEITGHANYKNAGSDIVCSSITTAVFTTINLFEKMYPDMCELTQNEKDGYLKCTLNYDFIASDRTTFLAMLIQNLIDVLGNIEDQYPKNLKVIINKL